MTQPDPYVVVKGYFDFLVNHTVTLGKQLGADLSGSAMETQVGLQAVLAQLAVLIYRLDQVVPGFANQYGADLDAVIQHYWPRTDGTPPPT